MGALKPNAPPSPLYTSASLAWATLATLASFGACATDNPREVYRSASAARGPTSGGASSSAARGGSTHETTGGSGGSGEPAGSMRGGSDGASSSRGGTRSSGWGAGPTRGGTTGTDGKGGTTGSGASGGTMRGSSGEGGDLGTGGEGNPLPDDGCGEPPISTQPFSKSALRSAAGECAIWHYCKFASRAAALDARIGGHVTRPSADTLERARTAWREAMSAWSTVELFQFGPLASSADSAGRDGVHGEGIRDLVYSWPLDARCRVEEELASQAYKNGFGGVLVSSRGLTALEYLLFYEGSDTACNPGTATANVFASLDADDLAARKLGYLGAVSGDVLANAHRLLERWDPAGGNFLATFVAAQGYEDEQQALTILGWALLYVEREVKDWKLGIPAGFTLNQPVNGPEASFAHAGTEAVVQNLRGFRRLFQGCGPAGEGLGFDDWLDAAGHGELGADILRALDAAETTAATFPPLDAATPTELESFYFTVKALTNLLKSDLFGAGSPLNLKLPMTVQGDTD